MVHWGNKAHKSRMLQIALLKKDVWIEDPEQFHIYMKLKN
jgi:hypothetical protein